MMITQDATAPTVISAPAEPSATEGELYGPVYTEARAKRVVACEQSNTNEIVVCAQVDPDKYRILVPLTEPKNAEEEIGKTLNVKIGNLELGSIDTGDGTRGFGLKLKF